MAVQTDPGAQVLLERRRRGVRMNSRVPLALEWQQADGNFLRENAHTRVVNAYGCLLVAPRSIERTQNLRLINLANFRSHNGVVVWKGKERTEGWEVGVELLKPEMDFWGLEL
jgi:hypothetical protein